MRTTKTTIHAFVKIINIAILFSVLLFSSCAYRQSCMDILLEFTQKNDGLPYGGIYLSGADEGSENFLSPSLIKVLYYDGAAEYEFSMIEEYAIYLSDQPKPCEVAVYKCYSRSDTLTVAAMCLERIEKLKILLADTAFAEIPPRADIDIKGHFVIVTML